jgi:exodeoxyribonuclease VII large subunit
MTTTVEITALTVSAYSARIERAVRSVGDAIVEGEVQKPQRSRNGLLYFDITDGDSTLSCKVFKRQIPRLKHEPREGDLVRIKVDRPDFWPASGKLSLVVADVELAGVGELLRRRASLLKKLQVEGLCDPDRWKPLPAFPRAVGVIAGRNSEGMSDVVRALRDRMPNAHIVTCPALVQGKSAPRDIIDALATLQQHRDVDVIIIARGGGSVQDLIAFDDERLCRAVFACAKPVVAAIGHTNNVPVCNHVTHAASTPSRSAEMVLPSLVDLESRLQLARQALDRIPAQVEHRLERLRAMGERLRRSDFLDSRQASIRELGQRIAHTETTTVALHQQGIAQAGAALGTVPHRYRATLAERERGIREQCLHLVGVSKRREEAAAKIAEQSRWIGDGIARQLVDHERDYGRAVNRLVTQMKHTALSRLEDESERLIQIRQLSRERIGHRFGNAERDLKHVLARIEARDFRRHGFVLATDAEGKPLSSIAGVHVGTTLNLSFRDGAARARVEETTEEKR